MHQCGLLGVRVGEASHPGPRVREKHRRRLASSSDDELLSRPMEGRDVIPRTDNSGSNRFAILAQNVPDGTPELEEAVVRPVSLDRDQVRAESLLDALEVDLQRLGPTIADSEFRSQHHCPGVASDLATTQMSSTMPASTVPASTVPASSRALCEAFSGGLLPVEVPLSVPGLASTQRDSSEDDVPLSSLGRTRQRFLEATQWDSGAEFSDVLVPGNSIATGIPSGVTVHAMSDADEERERIRSARRHSRSSSDGLTRSHVDRTAMESDTGSCQREDPQGRRRRRLQLTWNPTVVKCRAFEVRTADPKPCQKDRGRGERPAVAQSAP